MVKIILYAVAIIALIQLFSELSKSAQTYQSLNNTYKIKPQIQNNPSNDKIVVYWFFRNGCPHCDNMKESWNKLKSGNLPSNYTLIEVDTALEKNNKLSEKYGVNGVPHIIKTTSNGYYKVYSGDRSSSDMKYWILNN